MGCRSYLGRKGGKQEIRARACLDPATGGTWGKLLHEIMHTLGKKIITQFYGILNPIYVCLILFSILRWLINLHRIYA